MLAETRESAAVGCLGQATSQPRMELFAEGNKDYFLKVVDAQLTFVTNAQGRATAVVLHQNGASVTATRID